MTPLAKQILAETVAAVIATDVDGYDDGEYRVPTEAELHRAANKRRHWKTYCAKKARDER